MTKFPPEKELLIYCESFGIKTDLLYFDSDEVLHGERYLYTCEAFYELFRKWSVGQAEQGSYPELFKHKYEGVPSDKRLHKAIIKLPSSSQWQS